MQMLLLAMGPVDKIRLKIIKLVAVDNILLLSVKVWFDNSGADNSTGTGHTGELYQGSKLCSTIYKAYTVARRQPVSFKSCS